MQTNKLITLSNRCDILSLSAHILCCGVPAIASFLSLIGAAGLTGSTLIGVLDHYTESLHFAAFVFSTVMVAIAVGSYVIARKRDCVTEGHCHHEPCAPKKKASWKLLAVSLVLYTLNVAVFLLG